VDLGQCDSSTAVSRISSSSALYVYRRKSVENLLISSHDVIGSSISPSLTFGAMTLPTNCPQGHVANSLEIR
jgi:hypothetical protein